MVSLRRAVGIAPAAAEAAAAAAMVTGHVSQARQGANATTIIDLRIHHAVADAHTSVTYHHDATADHQETRARA